MAITQYLIQYWVIVPALKAAHLSPVLSYFTFSCLVIYTILIAAAGNIINDIFDAPIDKINKPNEVIVGKVISKKSAYWLYYSMNIIAISIAIYLDISTNQLLFTPAGMVIIALLYWYSKTFKRQILIGNLVIAILCAFVAVIVWWAELSPITQRLDFDAFQGDELTFLLLIYTLFALLSTMYREIIKDIQDVEGDQLQNCRTLPIFSGIKTAKWVAFLFGVMLSLSLIFPSVQLWQRQQYWSLAYLFTFILLPLFYSFIQLSTATKPVHFKRLSSLIKGIMLAGLGLLFAL